MAGIIGLVLMSLIIAVVTTYTFRYHDKMNVTRWLHNIFLTVVVYSIWAWYVYQYLIEIGIPKWLMKQ